MACPLPCWSPAEGALAYLWPLRNREPAMPIRATVWNEFGHERENETVRAIYPDGIHRTIADALALDPEIVVATATLPEPEHGLTVQRLAQTDVLLWWG